ncbi:MAG TPA: hypothetical protein PLE14_00295, partial [Anaerolineales bacterium]|nr:hypothetical protein [Anaerolineales bacterium]
MKQIKNLKKWLSLALAVFILSSCGGMNTPLPLTPTSVPLDAKPGSNGLDDSLYPDFGNGGYDTQHYDLNITVHNVSTSDMSAVTTIEAIATQDLSRFNLDFLGFDITRITVNEEAAEFERNDQELTVIPSQPIADGETFTIVVEYQGIPEEMTSVALPFPTGWIVYENGIYVLSEPAGSASFYPVNDHPLDKATYTLTVTVPKPFEVGAN